MAGRTPRFQFNFFGQGQQGTPNDDGQKFFGLDRVLLDRLLASVETHDHRYRPPVHADLPAPVFSLSTTGGRLQGGYPYFYRYAVVDQFGNETIASDELVVETPALLPMPAAPAVFWDEVTEGTLPPGIYYYALTALRGGEETPIGSATMMQILPGQSSATLMLPEYGEADAFRVWRMGSTEPGYTRIAVVDAPEDTFVDDGLVSADPCACDPGNAPPTSNTGTASYSITVTLPEEVDLSTARSWRLYRTMAAGVYPSSALVQEVVEREDEWDDLSPLLREWVDVGGTTQPGKPSDADFNMRFQPLSFDVVEELPDPTAYPAGYPLVMGESFYVKVGSDWLPVGGGGGGGMSPIMTSPSGSRFILSVDDAGALVTTPTDFPGPPPAPTGFTL